MVEGISMCTYNKSDVILFNSYCKNQNVVLSNLYDKCHIDYQGLVFHSSEQLFFWHLLDGNEEARTKVMETQTAKQCKKICSRYLKKMGWDDTQPQVQRAELQALRVAIDESQALLFYTRQAELARAQTRYGTTTKARSARCASSVDDGPRRKGKRSAAT